MSVLPRKLVFGLAAAWLLVARAAPAQVIQEVVFRVGENATIDWFAIDNPTVRGTLNVTNAPYAKTVELNAAAVGRNRLIFDTNTNSADGYAISLAGLRLVAGGATPVTVSSLGAWPGGGANAGYRKADGQVYYHPNGSDLLRRLEFGSTGLITGSFDVGRFNGNNLPNSITGGDIDFGANGFIWMTGWNDSGNPRLWNFDFATLNQLSAVTLSELYRGTTFNAAGDTLYGYKADTGQYGIIDTATGGFRSVLLTNQTIFGVSGDLATGTALVVVPEPSALGLVGMATLGSAIAARWRRGRRRP